MSLPSLADETATAIAALRDLILAVCRVRPDGAGLLTRLSQGTTRIVLDERSGMVIVGAAREDGDSYELLEGIFCDPRHEHDFGRLWSQQSASDRPTH